MRNGHRLKSHERRDQIINVTLDSVAEHGVTGTTLSRIAAGVGVTTPALYAHFANRKQILLAAVDVLIEGRTAHHKTCVEGNALDRLRQIGLNHTNLVASADDRSVLALFEFIAAPPEEGLREAVGARHLTLVGEIAEVVSEGQVEGTITPLVDAQQVAWMIVSRAWTEDIAKLMGVENDWNEERSTKMLDLILQSIATPGNWDRPAWTGEAGAPVADEVSG
jgi:AcrR family transcriptional regulator